MLKTITLRILCTESETDCVQNRLNDAIESMGENAERPAFALDTAIADATPEDIELAHKMGYDDQTLGLEPEE